MSSSRKGPSSKSSKNKLSTLDVLTEFARMLMDILIVVYAAVMLCYLPFHMPEGYSGLGTAKARFFETWSIFLWRILIWPLAVWSLLRLIDMIRRKSAEPLKKFCRSISVSEWCLGAYAAVVILSTRLSLFPETAWKGTSGWYMGALTQLLAIGAYFAVNRISTDAFGWVLLGIPASAVVFAVGYFNRFELLKLVEINDPSRLSFIGNINWYCGYLAVWLGFGIGIYLLCRTREGRLYAMAAAASGAYVVLMFGTMFTQQSASGLLAVAAVLLVLVGLLGKDLRSFLLAGEVVIFLFLGLTITWILCRMGLVINIEDGLIDFLTSSPLILLGLVLCLALYFFLSRLKEHQMADKSVRIFRRGLFVLTVLSLLAWFLLAVYNTSTGVLTEKFGLEPDNFLTLNNQWGSRRGATWYAALLIFREQDLIHRIFGVGGDCFYDAYKAIGGEAESYVAATFGSLRLTNAHNEYLTILVNFGFLGAVSYVAFILTSMYRMLFSGKRDAAAGVAFAAGLMLVTYTANNIPSFQQTVQLISMFLLAGIGERATRGILVEKD